MPKERTNAEEIIPKLRGAETHTDLASGQVLFRVDRFAFTANNISYAGAGDLLKYWNFFPTEQG